MPAFHMRMVSCFHSGCRATLSITVRRWEGTPVAVNDPKENVRGYSVWRPDVAGTVARSSGECRL